MGSLSAKNFPSIVFICLCLVSAMLQAKSVNSERLESISIAEFSQLVSERLELTIIMSPRVRDERKINIYAESTIPNDELYELYLNALLVHGYTAVREEGLVRVVRDRKARQMPLPVVQ